MPARMKVNGPTKRRSIFLYTEDVATIREYYPDFDLSGFVRSLVNRHCKAIMAKQKKGEVKGEVNDN